MRAFLIMALACALCGCALGPPASRPSLSLPATYDGWRPDGAPGSLDAWWTRYGDPQLTALIEEALTSAPDAKIARARLDEATAVRRGALSAFAPQGDIEAGAANVRNAVLTGQQRLTIEGCCSLPVPTGGVYDTQSASFAISWELDLFGRAATTRRGADATFAAARFDAVATRTGLAASVAEQLFAARGLAVQLEDAHEIERLDKAFADAVEGQATKGVVADDDARLARSLLEQARARSLDLEAQAVVSRRTLLALLGRGTSPLDALTVGDALEDPPAPPPTAPGDLLVRRPDVLEARQLLNAANAKLRLAELAQLPKVTLQPQLGLLNAPTLLGPAATVGTLALGAGLAQPIFDLPRLRTEIDAQDARTRRALVVYEQTLQQAYADVANAVAELAADRARAQRLTGAAADSRFALDAALARYGAGEQDLTAAIVAERNWRAARTELTIAKVSALRRSVQVFKALGGGWPAPGNGSTF